MSALDALVANFNANKGKMPQVNPPAAAKVLETQTKPEVAGQKPTDSATPGAQPAASQSAAPAISASSPPASPEPEVEKTPRRTAAVVQAELDQALAELAQTKAALRSLEGAELEAKNQLSSARLANDELRAERDQALKFAEQVVSDNAKLSEGDPTRVAGDLSVEGAAAFLKTRGFGIFSLGGQ